MAGILSPIQALLTLLKTIPVPGGDGEVITPTVRVWNNQVQYMRDPNGAKVESFPLPAFFPQITPDAVFEDIGQGYRGADLGIKIHIVHEYVDGGDGNFEQDLLIFGLRDLVIGYLTDVKLPGCGPLNSIGEGQEFDHDNVYHYTVDFVCNFTDSKGSRYDSSKPDAFIQSGAPVTLDAAVTLDKDAAGGAQVRNKFIINTKSLS